MRSALLAALALAAHRQAGRIYGYANIQRHLRQQKRDPSAGAETSIATGNRWGGDHQHNREAARRLRQQENAARRQAERGHVHVAGRWYRVARDGSLKFDGSTPALAVAA